MDNYSLPLWQKNFHLFLGTYSIIQMSGNIDDLVACKSNISNNLSFVSLDEWIWRLYGNRPNTIVVYYSTIVGFSNRFSPEHLQEFNRLAGHTNGDDFGCDVKKIVHAFSESKDKSIIVVFDTTIRCITTDQIMTQKDHKAFATLKTVMNNNTNNSKHRLVFLNERSSDIPSFIIDYNPYSKKILVPKPDQVQRSAFLSFLFSNRSFTQNEITTISQSAEDLTLKEIRRSLDTIDVNKCTTGDIAKQIRLFRYGFSEDPWSNVDMEKIDNAEEILGEYVFGQEQAIKSVVQEIEYATSGFSLALQEDGRTSPRGIMFFGGLSGTGKTELAQAIARLIFGSADSMIRFDMGEYNQPHSAERLTGAPPGYVGHDAGGQLTEAVKAHPYCLLLFDEIEKADSAVMNKFLSILDDGRLTDGKGETVSFENTIIIFTSNLGAEEASKETDPECVKQIISKAVREYCVHEIGKPELYSRLAGSIIAFNPLDDAIKKKIIKSQMEKPIKDIKEQLGICLEITPEFFDKFYKFIEENNDDDKFPGGRGMKKMIHLYFRRPLASFSRRNRCKDGDTIIVKDFAIDEDIVKIIGDVKRGGQGISFKVIKTENTKNPKILEKPDKPDAQEKPNTPSAGFTVIRKDSKKDS